MCGLLFFHGPNAQGRLSMGLTLLKHRGPDDGHSWANDRSAIGFRRLSINDQSELGRQPYQHKNYIGAINGEIYNSKTLIDRFGLSIEGQCDTRVILPLFDILGGDLIDELDGFYSGLIFDRDTERVVCIRDYIGKKPLFYGRSGEEFFITSELKAIKEIDWFKIVPLGMTELDCTSGELRVVSSHKTRLPSNKNDVLTLLEASVRKRMVQSDQPLGLFLSGGLDSSIIAYFASKFRDDIFYYTLADENSPDLKFVRILEKTLQLKSLKVVPLPTHEDLGGYINRVIFASESYNPSVISNGLATFLLAEAAKKDGVKVVLTGEGADELFCGYHHFQREDDWEGIRNELIHDLHFTELRRLDSCTMANGIEARCPFLDRSLKYFSDTLSYDDFFRTDGDGIVANKIILRDAFREKLPMEIINRAKTSFDVGSGMRALVVSYLKKTGTTEREAAKKIWRDLFGYNDTQNYFHSYPVFDSAIDLRGSTHRGKMSDKSIGEIESIILEKFKCEPFHNLYLLNGIFPNTGKSGGTCSDKTLSFLTLLREKGYKATLHSADIAGKKDIHRLVKLDVNGRKYFADIGNGWPSVKLFPFDKEVDYRCYGMRFRTEINREKMTVFHTKNGRTTSSLEIYFECKGEDEIRDDIANRFDGSTEYPFSNSVRFSQIVGDAFLFLRGNRLEIYRDGQNSAEIVEPISIEDIPEVLLAYFHFDINEILGGRNEN